LFRAFRRGLLHLVQALAHKLMHLQKLRNTSVGAHSFALKMISLFIARVGLGTLVRSLSLYVELMHLSMHKFTKLKEIISPDKL
jgi:hypothetical protein